jgi:endonuclease/exonuclease/phosphatase family metal-dependent hydrolase
MRLLAWNCAMALHKKAQAVARLQPDIAVISECGESSVLSLEQFGYAGVWVGSNRHKGLGLFVRKPLHPRPLPQPKQKWVLAADIEGYSQPLRVIAVWACRVGSANRCDYIGQLYEALRANPDWLSCRNTVVAGDFNSNRRWDSRHPIVNHSSVVELLAAQGIISAYHTFYEEAQGSESKPTLYLLKNRRRPFHLDYVFVPGEWAQRLDKVSIRDGAKWAALSDHRPVIVDVSLSRISNPISL